MGKIHPVPDPDNEPIDPFDPARYRADPIADFEVKKVLMTVPVRKPKRPEFFRVHPDPGYTVDMVLLERESGMDKESYLVDPCVRHLVPEELRSVRLFTCITKHGDPFLWPVKLPNDDHDRIRRMADAALQGAEQAKRLWVKLQWNKNLGAHDVFCAQGDLGDPQWTDHTFRDLFEMAFRGKLIDHPDHDVIRELRGEL